MSNDPPGPCCFYWKFNKCEPPRPPCRFRHIPDDGVTPCCFGATCRFGHKNRVAVNDDYWKKFRKKKSLGETCPAVRDATRLQSQLEPWSTAVLRDRLATVSGENHRELDPLGRFDIMTRLLNKYNNGKEERRTIRVLGTRVDSGLCEKLLEELRLWSEQHQTNTRPSIDAASYMILRTPMEFGLKKDSNKARQAAKKLKQHETLYNLAQEAIESVDDEYAKNFSALAVTKGFRGSPHIDKQNTGPFYGLSLGNFADGTGGVCVEVDAFTVAHVNTKERLGKIDGRYPHWVAPYEGDRYSLIFYSTWQDYQQPGPAYFGQVVQEE